MIQTAWNVLSTVIAARRAFRGMSLTPHSHGYLGHVLVSQRYVDGGRKAGDDHGDPQQSNRGSVRQEHPGLRLFAYRNRPGLLGRR